MHAVELTLPRAERCLLLVVNKALGEILAAWASTPTEQCCSPRSSVRPARVSVRQGSFVWYSVICGSSTDVPMWRLETATAYGERLRRQGLDK
jgi:hypothetical protein